MIFNWEEKFTEKLVLNGMEIEDDVEYLNRSINLLSGCVLEGGEEYWVYIELDDEFNIKSMECDCGEDKCLHMTALLHADSFNFQRDIEYGEFVGNLDNSKLMEFVKEQVDYNDDLKEDFIQEFRCDFINDKDFPLEDKLFLIMDYYDWESLITDFVKKDLTELFDDGYYSETFYLISLMYERILSAITYESESELNECYSHIVELLKKLSKTSPKLIRQFLKHCIEHNYTALYPPFRKLLGDLKDVL